MSSLYHTEPATNGKVIFHTSYGPIDVELWPKEAPLACRNLVTRALEGYFDRTRFHRVVPGFCVQGGDPTGTGEGGDSIWGRPFRDEPHARIRFNHRGQLAMANENRPDTNRAQFFFTLDECRWLDGKHTIFGTVAGDTVFNLLRMGEAPVGENDAPLEPIELTTVEVLHNPFDDIVLTASSAPRSSKEAAAAAEPASSSNARKPTKDVKLLSFGDDLDDDAAPDDVAKAGVPGDDPARRRGVQPSNAKLPGLADYDDDDDDDSSGDDDSADDADGTDFGGRVVGSKQPEAPSAPAPLPVRETLRDAVKRRSQKVRDDDDEDDDDDAEDETQPRRDRLRALDAEASDFAARMRAKVRAREAEAKRRNKPVSARGERPNDSDSDDDLEASLERSRAAEEERKLRAVRQEAEAARRKLRATRPAPAKLTAGEKKAEDDALRHSMLGPYEALRLKNKRKKISVKDRERDTLQRLSAFQSSLKSMTKRARAEDSSSNNNNAEKRPLIPPAQRKQQEAYHGQVLDDGDDDDADDNAHDWFAGKLTFKKHTDDLFRTSPADASSSQGAPPPPGKAKTGRFEHVVDGRMDASNYVTIDSRKEDVHHRRGNHNHDNGRRSLSNSGHPPPAPPPPR